MGIKELPRVARFIPKIMLAITVSACDEVYRKIASWLNDMGELGGAGARRVTAAVTPGDGGGGTGGRPVVRRPAAAAQD